MSDVPDWMRPVALPTLTQGKRVLAVEGDDDKDVYSAWLRKLTPRGTMFSDKLVVVDAGDKVKVLQGLIWYRDLPNPPSGELYGLVDRDEWDATTVSAKLADIPRLLVNLSRHCLESYFIDPSEIGSALRAKSQVQYATHIPAIRAAIDPYRLAWVDHWALWVTMCRVSRRLMEESFPGHYHDQIPLPEDDAIEERLRGWASVVEARAVFEAFRNERSRARTMSTSEQLHGCVHAKSFFSRIVVQDALHPCGGHNAKNWMLKLSKWMPAVPQDLLPILQPLLA
jgi:hypothetical protein